MALASKGVLEVRRTGQGTNSAYFNPSNANFAADLAATAALGAAPVVTTASYVFNALDAGHWLFVPGGPNWNPGYYPIQSVSGGAATLNAAAGAWYTYDPVTGQTGVSAVTGCGTAATPSGGTWGVDYTRSDNPRLSFTDLAINASVTTNFTSGSTPVGKNFVGNSLNVASGTGFTAGVYEVVSTAGITATCDRSLGTGGSTAGVGKTGGAFGGLGAAATYAPNGATVFLKFNATANPIGANLSFPQGNLMVVGYDTTRTIANADANRPVLQPAANGLTLITAGSNQRWFNLDFQNPGNYTGSGGINGGSTPVVRNCRFNGFQAFGATVGTGGLAEDLELINCGGANYALYANGATAVVRCIAKGCFGPGGAVFWATGGGAFIDCTSVGHSGAPGFGGAALAKNCLSHSGVAGGSGFGVFNLLEECIAYNNAGADYGGGTSIFFRLIRCFYGKVPTNYGPENASGCVQLTADPCNNAAAYDFTLNNAPGGGALVKGLTVPFPDGLTVSRPDAGPAQTAPAGGAASFGVIGCLFIKGL